MFSPKFSLRFPSTLVISLLVCIFIFHLDYVASPNLLLGSATIFNSQSYTPHDRIDVRNDAELAAIASSGTGTVNDPYLISGLNITNDAMSFHGILIAGTTKYFRIEKCLVSHSNRGIHVGGVAPGTAALLDNICSNNLVGIFLLEANFTSLRNNIFSGNSNNDILISASSSLTLVNNTFSNHGMYIRSDSHSKEELLSHTITDNTVNGLSLGYFVNLFDVTITESYGQLFLINCNSTVVRNQYMVNCGAAISLFHCHNSSVINNRFANTGVGISVRSSNSSLIAGNILTANQLGITVRFSYSSTLINNTCTSNAYFGIYLFSSGYSTLLDNVCKNSMQGIVLLESGSSNLTRNSCNNNTGTGISVSSSNTTTIAGNTCTENYDGIGLYFSSFSTLVSNLCYNNRNHGFVRFNSSSLTMIDNIFTNNSVCDIFIASDTLSTCLNFSLTIPFPSSTSPSESPTGSSTSRPSSFLFSPLTIFIVFGIIIVVKRRK